MSFNLRNDCTLSIFYRTTPYMCDNVDVAPGPLGTEGLVEA